MSGSTLAGGDIVSLSRRVSALSGVRVAVIAALLLASALLGHSINYSILGIAVVYALVTGLLSAAVLLIQHRPTAIGALGFVLCLDAVALQCVQYRVGTTAAVQMAMAIFLISVTLLSSLRTGIKLVIWQSLLIGMQYSGVENGLFERPAVGTSLADLNAEVLMLWLTVLVVGTGAAISEREIRRRRHDSERLQAFAAELHGDHEPGLVLRRSMSFVIEELSAGRALICIRREDRFQLVHAHGPVSEHRAPTVAAAGQDVSRSLLMSSQHPGTPTLLLRLDAQRDPWLSSLLPQACRLVVMPLGEGQTGETIWIVFEHHQSGDRVERRVLSTAGQLNAITALALSRAVLFQRAQAHASTDALTRLPNRRSFDLRLQQLSAGLNRAGFAVVLIDVDHFKSVNDTHGHQVGDQVLQELAATLRRGAPPEAMVARYGGEEFVVLIPGADAAAALNAAESLRAAVEAIHEPLPITASFGVATAQIGTDARFLLPAADAALYRVKRNGRNAVQLATAADLKGETADDQLFQGPVPS